jgi:cysteinyl-tRNA synthetase
LAVAAKDSELAFRAALADDLNAPEAVGALFTFIQKANAELDRKGADTYALAEARRVLAVMDGVLDVQPKAVRVVVGPTGVSPEIRSIEGLSGEDAERLSQAVTRLQERLMARRERDYARSDGLRAEVEEAGFVVKDSPAGTQLERYF